MNPIDIVILAILLISVLYGLYRGFVHTLLSMACCLISILLAFTFGPRLSAVISGNPEISSTLANYTDAVARVGDYDLASTPVQQLSQELRQQVLENAELPEQISEILEGNLMGQVFTNSGLFTVNEYVSNTVVAVAVNILSYILCFAISYFLLSLLVSLIRHVFRLPLLKQLDWLAGGAFGLIRGAALLYVLFLLVPILSTVIPLDAFNEMLAQSTLAPVFQSNGFFAGVISGIF